MGGQVRINAQKKVNYEVEVINIQGQNIQQFQWDGEERSISLGPIRTGKYFFRIKSASLLQIIPIIVY